MKKEALIIGVILIFLISIVSCVPTTPQVNEVIIHEFYNNGCPHCQNLNKWWDEIKPKYPTLVIVQYETSDMANADKFRAMAGAFNAGASSVPTLFIGEKVIVGFDPEQIEAEIKNCLEKKCISSAEKVPGWQK
jgi:glutaredoxin